MKLIPTENKGAKFDELYNHPDDSDDPDFIREYESFVDELEKELIKFGSVSVDNDVWGVDVDFAMSKFDTMTRAVVVVACNPEVFSKKLVDTILETLKKLPVKYRVILDGKFSHKDDFYLFIDQDEVSGWFSDPQKAGVFT